MTALLLLRLSLALAATVFAASGAAQEPEVRTENWPDGAIKTRWTVDAEGRNHGELEAFAANGTRVLQEFYSKGQRHGASREWDESGRKVRAVHYQQDRLHGRCDEFHPNGRTAAAGNYKNGQRAGSWTFEDEGGTRRKTAEYRDDVLHGTVRIHVGDSVASRQVWQRGELEQLDGMRPFPVPRAQLESELRAILAPPDALRSEADAPEAAALAAARAAALRRLQAYRHLCGLPWQGMSLVPEWNLRCDAAAEVCRRLGRLDHSPPRPDGIDDERYRLGVEGAGNSNLAVGTTLAGSVDSYMDDSDPSNIGRLGHRRWCLNPALRKVGFGSDGNYHAMWSMDGSGGGAKGLTAVYYPPRGYVPVDMFAARHAFSIGLVRGGVPKRADLSIAVTELDDDYVARGEPLHLDHCEVAEGGFGGIPCVAFRPVGIEVAPGRRYRVAASFDGGASVAHLYVVEFVSGVRADAGR